MESLSLSNPVVAVAAYLIASFLTACMHSLIFGTDEKDCYDALEKRQLSWVVANVPSARLGNVGTNEVQLA
jgi:hypothetical protein